jgi:hypothetical protein
MFRKTLVNPGVPQTGEESVILHHGGFGLQYLQLWFFLQIAEPAA